MSAKTELLERLEYIDTAVGLAQVIDVGVAPSPHNSVANLLRKGLCIVAFNILEDYIKNKANEALAELATSTITYSNLPDFLQEEAVVKALKSLNFQIGILKNSVPDIRPIIQTETKKISSTALFPFEFSKYTLLSSGSNIGGGEVTDVLKAFGITGGWAQLKNISDSIGGGIPDLSQAFNNASARRHSSAHSASFNYNHSWLRNLKSEILAIAASIDIAVSVRCRQARTKPLVKLDTHDLNSDMNFIFFETHGSVYKETKVIGGKSRKNWTNINLAFAHHAATQDSKKLFLIHLDASRRIINWQV